MTGLAKGLMTLYMMEGYLPIGVKQRLQFLAVTCLFDWGTNFESGITFVDWVRWLDLIQQLGLARLGRRSF